MEKSQNISSKENIHKKIMAVEYLIENVFIELAGIVFITFMATVHRYKGKSRITLIFTDSFLANKLFMIKLFIIIDKNVSFVIVKYYILRQTISVYP